jgi:hypothetical protein
MHAFVAALLVAVAATTVSAGSPPPALAPSFCAHMQDTLLINGTAVRHETYALCMDVARLAFRREDAIAGGAPSAQVSLFVNKTIYRYKRHADGANASGCTFRLLPSSAAPTKIPFSFILIDAVADDNGMRLVHGRMTNDWEHQRPARKSGAFRFPAEDMNWFVTQAAPKELAMTRCAERYDKRPGDGGTATLSVGARDYFHGPYAAPAAPAEFDLPAGLQCKPEAHGEEVLQWLF